jgi:hypothetical protein
MSICFIRLLFVFACHALHSSLQDTPKKAKKTVIKVFKIKNYLKKNYFLLFQVAIILRSKDFKKA